MIQAEIPPSGDWGPSLTARHIISGSATIRETLVALNQLSGDSMTLFAIDTDDRLIGSVTDGDIRRAIIAGHTTDDPVSGIAFRNFISLPANASPQERYRTVAKAHERRVNLLPVTSDGRLTGVIDVRRMKSAIPADAVLMAGGRGERLRPLTLDTPKPLLK
ncbi:MAG: hypothetical protein K2F93_04905, partial [Muribaculaceae bacterium]|nr:hypothetical protein [Muribaculaceae bacterium]